MKEFDPSRPYAAEANRALHMLERTDAGQRFLEKIDRQAIPDYVPALFDDARQDAPEQHPAVSLAIALVSGVPNSMGINLPRLVEKLEQELHELEKRDRLPRFINAVRPAFAFARAVAYHCFR